MLQQSIPEGLHPMEGTHAGAVCVRTVAHRRDPCWTRSWRNVSHGRDTMLEHGSITRRKK